MLNINNGNGNFFLAFRFHVVPLLHKAADVMGCIQIEYARLTVKPRRKRAAKLQGERAKNQKTKGNKAMPFTTVHGKRNSNIFGSALERSIKYALNKKDYGWLSPTGRCDFRHGKCYDVKQNSSPILYGDHYQTYIRGSSRVIYATHISYEVISETEDTIELFVNLAETDLWVVDRKEFVDHLLGTPGLAKYVATRNQVNIQTLYNYKRGAYHGRKGLELESWLDDHKLTDDPVIEDILDGFFERNIK